MNILILLIGSNPLPNYIVGNYLIKKERAEKDVLPEPDKTILVYSDDTEKFAKRISNKLGIQPEYVDLKRDEREPAVIVKGIQDKLDLIAKAGLISTIHLNYTGGTKPMSLYAHIAVSGWIGKDRKKDKIKVILSDIDPKNHKIVLREKPDYPLDGDLLDHVKPDMKTILDLHGMKTDEDNPGQEISCFSLEITDQFAKEAIEESIKKTKDNKREKAIHQELMRIDISLKGRTDEEKEKYLEKNSDKLNEIMAKTKTFFSYLIEDFEKRKNIIQCPNLSFIKFFKEGGWLEDFVLNTLIKLKKSSNLHEIRKNVRANYNQRDTELDVIAIRGYKLFLVSCTTYDGIKIVKEKAFEAIYRAEQLGGEHAKAIVISLMYNRSEKGWEKNDLEELQKDLAQFDAARNCRLIGIDELHGECQGNRHLTQRLKNIIMGVE